MTGARGASSFVPIVQGHSLQQGDAVAQTGGGVMGTCWVNGAVGNAPLFGCSDIMNVVLHAQYVVEV